MALPGFGGGEHGFFAIANSTLKRAENRSPPELTDGERAFLTKEFPSARDRTNALASTVGTAGSFLVVLITLVVGLAGGLTDKSQKVVEASNNSLKVSLGCSDQDPRTECTAARNQQAADAVKGAQDAFAQTVSLTKRQAIAVLLTLAAFLLGLWAQFVNPVPGPNARLKSATGISEWNAIQDRYGLKRLLIIPSLLLQVAAGAVVLWMALDLWL